MNHEQLSSDLHVTRSYNKRGVQVRLLVDSGSTSYRFPGVRQFMRKFNWEKDDLGLGYYIWQKKHNRQQPGCSMSNRHSSLTPLSSRQSLDGMQHKSRPVPGISVDGLFHSKTIQSMRLMLTEEEKLGDQMPNAATCLKQRTNDPAAMNDKASLQSREFLFKHRERKQLEARIRKLGVEPLDRCKSLFVRSLSKDVDSDSPPTLVATATSSSILPRTGSPSVARPTISRDPSIAIVSKFKRQGKLEASSYLHEKSGFFEVDKYESSVLRAFPFKDPLKDAPKDFQLRWNCLFYQHLNSIKIEKSATNVSFQQRKKQR